MPEGVIAIDGKTVRRSSNKRSGKAAIDRVSAFAACQRVVPGQLKVAEKSNEIIAIPKLLDMLAIKGAMVTMDAMGCQRELAQKIIDKKADYVLALKGNRGSLREDVEIFAAGQTAMGFADTRIRRDSTIDGDHGRIETRTTTVIDDVEWLQERHNWPGLKAVVMLESTREIGGKTGQQTRFHITSLVMLAHLPGAVVRSHWPIGNSLHWVLDMVFRDDGCRVRTEHAPANFAAIKHMAQNLLRNTSGENSLRGKRKAAGWDDDFLVSLITG
jgi:predicted transposase YbfD/YdcC